MLLNKSCPIGYTGRKEKALKGIDNFREILFTKAFTARCDANNENMTSTEQAVAWGKQKAYEDCITMLHLEHGYDIYLWDCNQ